MEENIEDETAIDLENLQAQIDLSMSFAQNMVSSWMKNTRNLPSRARDMDNELKEYMKRPPRLGVGAAVPESSVSSRDVARLKGQLTEKKRPREEGVVKKEDSDDEGESRAGAIKKKARVDPFQIGGKKPKVEKSNISAAKDLQSPSANVEASKTKVHPPIVRIKEEQSTPKKVPSATTHSSPLIPTSLPPLESTPPHLPTFPLYARRLAQSDLLQGSVLNLKTSQSDEEMSDETMPNTSLEQLTGKKKKRRRRKKKKADGDSSLA